jgi:hypothetical protein
MSNTDTNASHTFVDLATFSEIEGFLYGGPDAITWFVAAVQKANWFSFIPISLRHQGTIDFGQKNVSACVNRSGDYVMHIWFRCQIPQIHLHCPSVNDTINVDAGLRWTNNLMHNLFEKVSITFNELNVQEFDSYWLDFNMQYRQNSNKRTGYRNMIGDVASMTNFQSPSQDVTGAGAALNGTPVGTGGFFSVDFPFWFSQDTGLSLPVAALPFNDIKVNYTIRAWQDLVVVYPGTAGAGPPTGGTNNRVAGVNDVYVAASTSTRPSLIDPQTRAHYAVVHNDERVKMGDAPRDMLIHQVQSTQNAPFKEVSSRSQFDLRLSHSVVGFCFSARNTSLRGDYSNYSVYPRLNNNFIGAALPAGQANIDPIAKTHLHYENTVRVSEGSDYFSLIMPYLMMPAIPDEGGYHSYSYSLRPWDPLRPAGSTNYSKLANVSLAHHMSPACVAAGTSPPTYTDGTPLQYPNSAGVLTDFLQTYEHVFRARNHNIARVANGSLGHPTL